MRNENFNANFQMPYPHGRDNSIYGHYLIPLELLTHEPANPMQHLEDLKSDLAFSEASNRDGHLAFVPSSQETTKKCIADLEELVLIRARLSPPASVDAHDRIMTACEQARQAMNKIPYDSPERTRLWESAMQKIYGDNWREIHSQQMVKHSFKAASVDTGTRKEETPTPRVDAELGEARKLIEQYGPDQRGDRSVRADFARTLERELNAKHAELIRWMVQSSDWCHAHKAEVAALTTQRDSLAEQLEEAKKERIARTDAFAMQNAHVGKLAQQVAALEADKRRLDWLEGRHRDVKWADAGCVLSSIRPDESKYIDEVCTLRAAIDSALSANPRLLSEGGEGK